jgi:hypothetical protein
MSSKRPRGGQHQRLDRAANAYEPVLNSCLAEFLTYQFAWGHFSAQMIQEIAALALKDIHAYIDKPGKFTELEKLASAGSNGKHINNVHRDVMSLVGTRTKLPNPCNVKIEFGLSLGSQIQAILLPHEMFSCIFHNYPNTWSLSVLPSQERLASFWEANQGHPNMSNHPVKLIEN